MKTKRNDNSLSDTVCDLLKLLDLKTRLEIEANNQRKDYSFMETAVMQHDIGEKSKSLFPPGRSPKDGRKDSEKCQDVGTLKSLGYNRVDEVVGEIFHESAEMVRRRRIILKAVRANPEKYSKFVKRIDNGQTSIEYTARMIENEEKKLKPSPKLPEGEFDLIVMDFPWNYDLQLSGAPNYKTMTVEEGKKQFPSLPTHKDCVLAMWVTNPKIEDAIELVHFWNFRVVTSIFWIKAKDGKPEPDSLQVGTGYTTKGAHEMLWICYKGNPKPPSVEDRFPSVLFAPRGKHSEKPDEMYIRLEKMYYHSTKLDIFARKRRKKWTSFGDELEDET